MNYIKNIMDSIEHPQTLIEDNMQSVIEGFEHNITDFSTLRKFLSLEGMLDYLLFIPSGLNDKTRLLVMLHGCQQTAQEFAHSTQMNKIAEKENLIVLYPEQQKLKNSHGCWNWFNKKGNSIGEELLIRKLIERVKNHFDIKKVYVAGISAGGAMATVLAHEYPDLFTAFAVHSGLPYLAATKAQDALEAMKKGRQGNTIYQLKVPAIVIHGRDDNVVNKINSEQIIEDILHAHDNKLSAQMKKGTIKGLNYSVISYKSKKLVAEYWLIDNLGHNWSGGKEGAKFTNEKGPCSSQLIMNFFNKIEA